MNMEPIGILFNSVEYYKPEDVKSIVDGLTIEQSIYFISQSLEFANKNSLFSLVESEIVSKSLRILTNEILSSSPQDK